MQPCVLSTCGDDNQLALSLIWKRSNMLNMAFLMLEPKRWESWNKGKLFQPLINKNKHLKVLKIQDNWSYSFWTWVFAGDVEVDEVLSNNDIGDAIAIISHLKQKERKKTCFIFRNTKQPSFLCKTAAYRTKSSSRRHIFRVFDQIKQLNLLHWGLTGGQSPRLWQNL